LDWREITEASDRKRVDEAFDTANNVLDESWRRVLSYAETNWKAALA
jgi:hypothetical protein